MCANAEFNSLSIARDRIIVWQAVLKLYEIKCEKVPNSTFRFEVNFRSFSALAAHRRL